MERERGVIERLLPYGEENAVSTAELLRLSGIKDARTLQETILYERVKKRIPILSRSRGGYFLPSPGEAGEWELRRFCHTLHNRARRTFKTARAVEKAMGETGEQTEIVGW